MHLRMHAMTRVVVGDYRSVDGNASVFANGDGAGEGFRRGVVDQDGNGFGGGHGNGDGVGYGDGRSFAFGAADGDGFGDRDDSLPMPLPIVELTSFPHAWAQLHRCMTTSGCICEVYGYQFWVEGTALLVPTTDGTIRHVAFFVRNDKGA